MSKNVQMAYQEACKWYAVVPPVLGVPTLFYNVPFGRFSRGQSKWMVDGIKAWMIMEIMSPIFLTLSYLNAPLRLSSNDSPVTSRLNPLTHPPALLILLFLVHYTHRSIISPLRTPSRSKAHISVPLVAIAVNIVNGSMLGTYLSSPEAEQWLAGAYISWRFWALVSVWAAGFFGNMIHDEVLLEMRRDMQKKRARDGPATAEATADGEYYGIPHGYLYKYVSYPNYLCEWIEWGAFALASAPLPSRSNGVAPPWAFFFEGIYAMLPRAYRGHEWYHQKFGAAYPKERRAVVPFLF